MIHFSKAHLLIPQLVARGFLFELVQVLGYVVLRSVSEEHIDDLSQFFTSTSRIQLFHDAALIGKAVNEGTAMLGLTLSCKSTSWQTTNPWGWSSRGLRCCHLFGNITHRLVDRNRSGDEAQKTHDDGHTLFKSTATPCRARPPHKSMRCAKNFKMGTVMGKTQACAISTVAWFFGEKRAPQTATRVEQVSEWITMWRGFNVDTRRRIREVWRKKVPIWAKDPYSGTKLQVQSLPPFARCWRRAGSRAHQVSGKRQTPAEMQTWNSAAGIRSKVPTPTLPRRPGLD